MICHQSHTWDCDHYFTPDVSKCPEDMFQCDSGDCVYGQCDGEADCDDKSDEVPGVGCPGNQRKTQSLRCMPLRARTSAGYTPAPTHQQTKNTDTSPYSIATHSLSDLSEMSIEFKHRYVLIPRHKNLENMVS